MFEPITPVIPTAVTVPRHHSAFHELLSELNPLQYLPVIGTIYRAVTGDTIPAPARLAGGFVVSGLIGGPIGVVFHAAELTAEHALGIDPDRIGTKVLAAIGIGTASVPVATAHAAPPPPHGLAAPPRAAEPLAGAEALNQRELDRLAAYSA